MSGEQWPSLPLDEWRDTYATLHMWLQIVGKVRTRLSAPVNHSWSSALFVTARGLTTSPLHSGSRTLEMSFDFVDHKLFIHTTGGAVKVIGLFARSVAEFYHELFRALHALDIRHSGRVSSLTYSMESTSSLRRNSFSLLRAGIMSRVTRPGWGLLAFWQELKTRESVKNVKRVKNVKIGFMVGGWLWPALRPAST